MDPSNVNPAQAQARLRPWQGSSYGGPRQQPRLYAGLAIDSAPEAWGAAFCRSSMQFICIYVPGIPQTDIGQSHGSKPRVCGDWKYAGQPILLAVPGCLDQVHLLGPRKPCQKHRAVFSVRGEDDGAAVVSTCFCFLVVSSIYDWHRQLWLSKTIIGCIYIYLIDNLLRWMGTYGHTTEKPELGLGNVLPGYKA